MDNDNNTNANQNINECCDNTGQNVNGYSMNTRMNTQNSSSSPEYTKVLILSIIQLLCCSQITGIISLIFVILANTDYRIGNIVEYNAKIKTAKTSLIVGWILGALIYIFAIMYCMLIIILELA